LTNYQFVMTKKVLDAYYPPEEFYIFITYAPLGYGKCLSPDSLIATPDGFTPIKSVKVGQPILGFRNGKLTIGTVLAKHVSEKALLTIQCGKNIIKPSLDHHFLTREGWKKAEDLNVNDTLVMWNYAKWCKNASENKEAQMEQRRRRKGYETIQRRILFQRDSEKSRPPLQFSKKQNYKKIEVEENAKGTLPSKNAYLEEATDRKRVKLFGWDNRWRRVDRITDSNQQEIQKRFYYKTNDINNEFKPSTFGLAFKSNGYPSLQRQKIIQEGEFRLPFSDRRSQISAFCESHSSISYREKASSRINVALPRRKDESNVRHIYTRNVEDILGIQKSEFEYRKIQSIRGESEKTQTYDLTTSIGNYIANGFVVHNSSYDIKCGVEVLQRVYHLSEDEAWEKIKQFIVFHPTQFFEKIQEIENTGFKRVPFIIWEDMGLWLYALDYRDPFIEAFIKYLNVARTHLGALIGSSPSPEWVLRKLRRFPSAYTIRVQKVDGHTSHTIKASWLRDAVGYKFWLHADLRHSGVRKIWVDRFHCKMRDDFFEWYKPVRDSYEDMALQLLREKWEQMSKKGKALMLENYPTLNLPKLERNL